jgi:hypothetical protein
MMGKQIKQETLEEVAKGILTTNGLSDEDMILSDTFLKVVNSMVDIAKWQQERSYSDEEALNLLTHFAVEIQRQNKKGQYPIEIKSWFERNKEKFKNK